MRFQYASPLRDLNLGESSSEVDSDHLEPLMVPMSDIPNSEGEPQDPLLTGFSWSTNLDKIDVGPKYASRVVDFSWLHEGPKHQKENLPEMPFDKVLEGLSTLSTDGVDVFPKDFDDPSRSKRGRVDGGHLRAALRSATMAVASGVPYPAVILSFQDHMGEKISDLLQNPSFPKIASYLRGLRAEYGLLGKVYLREDTFRNTMDLKKALAKPRFSSVKYVLKKRGSKLGDSLLSRKVVSSIPWEEAVEIYKPVFEVSGNRIASTGSPKNDLRRAFLSSPKSRTATTQWTYSPKDLSSFKEAWAALKAYQPQAVVVHPNERSFSDLVNQEVSRMASVGLLTSEAVQAVMAIEDHSERLRLASKMAVDSTIPKGVYQGSGVGSTLLRELPSFKTVTESEIESRLSSSLEKRLLSYRKQGSLTLSDVEKIRSLNVPTVEKIRLASLRASDWNRVYKIPESKLASFDGPKFVEEVRVGPLQKDIYGKAATILREGQIRRLTAALDSMVVREGLPKSVRDEILAMDLTPREKLNRARHAVMQIQPKIPDWKPAAQYDGHVVKAAHYTPLETKGMRASNATSDPRSTLAFVSKVSDKIATGVAGPQLDSYIRENSTPEIRKAASERLVQIRRKHEALSGRLYVDSSKYASDCDSGAAIHRGTETPYVLMSPQCSGCVRNTEGHCSVYRKPLVEGFDPSDLEAYQKETLVDLYRKKEAPSNVLDASKEFGLSSPSLSFSYQNDPEPLVDIHYGESPMKGRVL